MLDLRRPPLPRGGVLERERLLGTGDADLAGETERGAGDRDRPRGLTDRRGEAPGEASLPFRGGDALMIAVCKQDTRMVRLHEGGEEHARKVDERQMLHLRTGQLSGIAYMARESLLML